MLFIRPFYLLLLLLAAFAAPAQITEQHYRIYSVKEGKEVPLSAIAAAMDDYDVLFYGEEHNDSVTHYLEHAVLKSLFEKYGSNTALSMEMFDRDVQPVMNEYLQGFIREKNFTKDARTWKNYRDYQPMVELAKKNGLDVVCANAPGRYTNLAGRKGQQALLELPTVARLYMAPLPYDTASGKYYEKLMALTSHDAPAATDTAAKKMPPAMGNFNMIPAQSLWDATMAWSIASYLKRHKGKKVMQVNGRFHSDEGFAVVTQLKKYAPKLRVLIISTGSDKAFPKIDWSQHQHLGDFIIITDPAVPKTFEQ